MGEMPWMRNDDWIYSYEHYEYNVNSAENSVIRDGWMCVLEWHIFYGPGCM
jgi:hypothetical protein